MNTRGIWLCGAAILVGTAGCGSSTGTAAKQERSHLKLLAVLYDSACSTLHRPPQNEAEFKKELAAQKGKMLEVLHVDNVEEVFISERDGQPYVVQYGTPNPKAPTVVAYEKAGVGGRRLVGFTNGSVAELDEAKFRETVQQ